MRRTFVVCFLMASASCGGPRRTTETPEANVAASGRSSPTQPAIVEPAHEPHAAAPEIVAPSPRPPLEVPTAPAAPRRLGTRFTSEPPPALDPALTVERIRLQGRSGRVVGFAPRADGRWLVAHSGTRSNVWLVDPARAPSVPDRAFASGLDHPTALAVNKGRVFVLQRDELTELVDRDGDGAADEYRVAAELPARDFPNAQALAVDHGFFAAIFGSEGALRAVVGSLEDGRITVQDLCGAHHARVAPGFGGSFLVVGDSLDSAAPRVHWIGMHVESSWSNTLIPDLALRTVARMEVAESSARYLLVGRDGAVARLMVSSNPAGFDVSVVQAGTLGSEPAIAASVEGGAIALSDASATTIKVLRAEPGGLGVVGARGLPNGIELEFTAPLALDCGWEPDFWIVGGEGDSNRPDWVSISEDRRRVFLARESSTATIAGARVDLDGERGRASPRFGTAFVSRVRTQLGVEEPRGERRALPDGIRNVLSEADVAGGWRLLFDGTSTAGWKNYGKDGPVEGWAAENGELVRVGDGGDLVTEEEFSSFELELDWRITPGGNSGIFFHVVDGLDAVWRTGPEMQILDNSGHADGANALTSAGSNYALHAPEFDDTRPVGAWNHARLVVDGAHVEHWLNGEKQCEYELWSDDWRARVAASKFASMPDYGLAKTGRIALQDHGDRVAFKNVKLRPITR